MNFCFCSSQVGSRGRFDRETDDVTDDSDSEMSPCSRGSTAMMMLF